eukprot:SAG31_NODE_31188_length_371_cov_0.621324_1_plen_64_part_01
MARRSFGLRCARAALREMRESCSKSACFLRTIIFFAAAARLFQTKRSSAVRSFRCDGGNAVAVP